MKPVLADDGSARYAGNLKEYRFRVVMTEVVTAYNEVEARDILEGSNAGADFHSVEVEEVRELARER